MIKKLADHYFPGPQHAEDHQQLIVEWQKAKYDLLQWKENDLPQAIRQGEGSITATDWCLSKLMQPPYSMSLLSSITLRWIFSVKWIGMCVAFSTCLDSSSLIQTIRTPTKAIVLNKILHQALSWCIHCCTQ